MKDDRCMVAGNLEQDEAIREAWVNAGFRGRFSSLCMRYILLVGMETYAVPVFVRPYDCSFYEVRVLARSCECALIRCIPEKCARHIHRPMLLSSCLLFVQLSP
ncbi:hypothetical protein KP509_01G025700 [Ceratopteris richardii]|uniref:Uncharacterized protein n=1 Tax=Ceratopteris richardii TaxID=49495 RepID=A0A8T2VBI0_CERRI|nr:hypothetical protein KP509_01G025700 [Ceratopteris richardii]